jgi:aminoglycoside N3'-acetyltransferase
LDYVVAVAFCFLTLLFCQRKRLPCNLFLFNFSKILINEGGAKRPPSFMQISISHYVKDVGVSSAKGAGNTNIFFCKSAKGRLSKKDVFNENC